MVERRVDEPTGTEMVGHEWDGIEELFAQNCAACHGPDGKGNRQFGAPNLTDAIWLYGGDEATIRETLTNGRGGVMPHWGGRLDPATIKMLAAYVHSLGGGEGGTGRVRTAGR